LHPDEKGIIQVIAAPATPAAPNDPAK
jgi:hypothetical protein